MNDPIISPLWVYLILKLDAIIGFFITLSILFFLLAIFAGGGLSERGVKKLLYYSFVLLFLGTVLPNSKVTMAMLVANYITPARIQQLGIGVDSTETLKSMVKELTSSAEVKK